jgi:hypothetical protein
MTFGEFHASQRRRCQRLTAIGHYRFRVLAALPSGSQVALAAEDEQQPRIGVLLLVDEGSTGE